MPTKTWVLDIKKQARIVVCVQKVAIQCSFTACHIARSHFTNPAGQCHMVSRVKTQTPNLYSIRAEGCRANYAMLSQLWRYSPTPYVECCSGISYFLSVYQDFKVFASTKRLRIHLPSHSLQSFRPTGERRKNPCLHCMVVQGIFVLRLR